MSTPEDSGPTQASQGNNADSLSSSISRAAVRLVADYTGRGPTTAHTVINRDSVIILMGDTLTKGERKLAASGMGDHVLATRRHYQSVMQPELIEAVEERTGRKVSAFMSDNHIDPDLAVEVMVFEGAPVIK